MARPIGYYVHHHGDGHRQRALAIASNAPERFVLLGTGLAGRAGDIAAIDLPDDRLPDRSGFDGEDDSDTRPLSLHYAPLDHNGVRKRVAVIAGWIARERPALMVIDVSVEIAMLARLASVPTVYVRLSGRRDDPAHADAFRGAAAILAPFDAALDDAAEACMRAKTFHAPGLLRPAPDGPPVDRDTVLVVKGRGGAPADADYWAAVARAVPSRRWRLIGPATMPGDVPPNLTLADWIDDADRVIASAGIVVGGAGDGLIASVIAYRRPFLCLPEPRPYDEQSRKADRLTASGAAIRIDALPAPADWPALLAAAQRLDPRRLAALDDPNGALRTARRLIAIADAPSHPTQPEPRL